jgi:16S rRNA processing protein RimM
VDIQAEITHSAWPEDAIQVARIAGAWGVKGWLKVQCFGSNPQSLLSTQRWFVKPPEEELGVSFQKNTQKFSSQLHVLQAREHGSVVVAQVKDVLDRSQAEAMRGAEIFIARAHFAPAKAGEYYWIDLIGLSVVNRQGQSMGIVVGLLDTGPHSVLRLSRPEGEVVEADVERMIPFVAAYIDDVSLSERRITVDWGLDY